MPTHNKRTRATLAVEALETREMLSAAPLTPAFAVQAGGGYGRTAGLDATGGTNVAARAWLSAALPADVQANVQLYADNATPAQLLVRGSNLNTAVPTYYALAVTRGLKVQLVRVVNGSTTVLAQLQSGTYLSNRWLQLSLQASGPNLQAYVKRLDTSQYLNARGQWQTTPVSALDLNDYSIRSGGLTGLGRAPGAPGIFSFDNLSVTAVSTNGTRPPVYAQETFDFTRGGALPAGWQQWSNQGTSSAGTPGPSARWLSVSIAGPRSGSTVTSPTAVQATVWNATRVDHVNFLVDGVPVASDWSAPYSYALDPTTLAVGPHSLEVIAYDRSGATAQSWLNFSTRPGSSGNPLASIPQHYSWIRLAELAYAGTPIDSFAQQLLKSSVDLVIPNSAYLQDIDAASPKTPQLIYTNFSNIYQELLTNWDNWADAHHVSRESAFYHVTKPTPFSGSSSGSAPVNWFWGVYQGGDQVDFTDLTYAAHTWTHSVDFGGFDTSMYLAYPEQFREIDVNVATPASRGWAAQLEYPTAVDAEGNPTAWAPLDVLRDRTGGLKGSGQITFDPPSNWVPASVNGSALMYFVRWRTTSDGNAPVANAILGRNYTNSRSGYAGTIPVFDYAADTNHDGYLNDKEYAVALRAGDTARFAYESRLFMPSYGPMRTATNPSSSAFRAWAADYAVQLLKSQPLADGLFVDNSGGKSPAAALSVWEASDTYAADYGALLGGVERAVPSHLVLGNTSGGGANADPVLSQSVASFEEFAIRPLAQNWQQFEDLAGQVAHRDSLTQPPPYQVLDSLPTNGSPTDGRTQLATLAEYYLLADPKSTFLDFFGGYSPASSWTQHWSPAAAYDVGQPLGTWSLFASGADPSNRSLTYHVYQRNYTNSLVLYRPLAHTQGNSHSGSLGSPSAVTFRLNGTYRPLRGNGTLGSPVTSVTLRDGEGAILIKV
jgi:hypothetical protein